MDRRAGALAHPRRTPTNNREAEPLSDMADTVLTTPQLQERVEAIFRKGMDPAIDSYSAFFDNGRRKSTGLADFLRGRGARELWLCGLAGDICVHYSARDALDQLRVPLREVLKRKVSDIYADQTGDRA